MGQMMSINKKQKTPSLFLHFARIYPIRFAIALGALLLAGFVETIGIGALLPLLNLVLENSQANESDILSQAINTVFNAIGLTQNFQNLLLVIVLAISLKSLIIFQALKIVSYIAVDITYDMRRKLIAALLGAQWKYYSVLNIGQSANAIATEADHAGQFCVIIGKTISAAIQASVYVLIAFAVDWKVSLAAIILGGAAAFILKFLVRMARDAGNDMADTLNSLLARLDEALSGAKPIKAMGEEHRYATLLEKDTLGLQGARKKLALSSLLLNLAHEPAVVLFMAIGLFWAFSYANFPLSELFMMGFLFNRLLSQVNLVQNHYQKSALFEGAVSAVIEKTQIAKNNQEDHKGTVQPHFGKAIEIKNLGLAYDKTRVFKDISEQIPAHKFSVIFGPSGSGKSSLLDAILGLTPYQTGCIYIDNTALEKINIKAWRQIIGYVPQETFLFHDTITQNVTLGDDNISEEQVIQALKDANAWDFICKFEDGINHIVGEKGGKLSGGQRQRIAVARALARSPKILILDEATSSLDKASEQSILSTLKEMVPSITIIMISHDPKTLDIADHVIYMGKEE